MFKVLQMFAYVCFTLLQRDQVKVRHSMSSYTIDCMIPLHFEILGNASADRL